MVEGYSLRSSATSGCGRRQEQLAPTLMAARHLQNSRVRGSRRGRKAPRSRSPATRPDGWTKTCIGPRLCGAVADRLSFAGEMIETSTSGYRLASARRKRPELTMLPARPASRAWAGTVPGMLVSDLSHFLDLPPDIPGPARALAGHLSDIVRAATAGETGNSVGNRAALSAPARQPPLRRPDHR